MIHVLMANTDMLDRLLKNANYHHESNAVNQWCIRDDKVFVGCPFLSTRFVVREQVASCDVKICWGCPSKLQLLHGNVKNEFRVWNTTAQKDDGSVHDVFGDIQICKWALAKCNNNFVWVHQNDVRYVVGQYALTPHCGQQHAGQPAQRLLS
jgi:hypothetical protein